MLESIVLIACFCTFGWLVFKLVNAVLEEYVQSQKK